MKYFRYLLLLALLALPLAYSQAEVRIGVGFGPAYVAGPPVCAYGYYSYYPYACAPYGYYGPSWFANGVFIGAGPWYHARPYYRGFYGRDYDRRFYGREYYGRSYEARRFHDRDFDRDRYRGRDEHFRGEGFREHRR